LCEYFQIDRYFQTIDGSPIKKEKLVANILQRYHYKPNESILIGDALTDYNAAVINGIEFYGYNNLDLQNKGYYIKNFRDVRL